MELHRWKLLVGAKILSDGAELLVSCVPVESKWTHVLGLVKTLV